MPFHCKLTQRERASYFLHCTDAHWAFCSMHDATAQKPWLSHNSLAPKKALFCTKLYRGLCHREPTGYCAPPKIFQQFNFDKLNIWGRRHRHACYGKEVNRFSAARQFAPLNKKIFHHKGVFNVSIKLNSALLKAAVEQPPSSRWAVAPTGAIRVVTAMSGFFNGAN